ncbi:MAG TPA: ABC transporter permease [Vicinamibacterales bacterium]|nr:ABC transporter permease [Vicinamibacterales bacterium]
MGLWQDIRISARMLVKDRWYTTVAVLALGLGIGVTSTGFTFVNAVLLRGLPYPDSDRIMFVSSRSLEEAQNDMGSSYPDYEDWRAAQRSFGDLAAMRTGTMNVSDATRPAERTSGAYVTANAFRILGQPMRHGRDFAADDDKPGAPSVAIIGYGLWQSRYAGNASIIGRVIRVNETPTVIVGVMPEGVQFPSNADMWQPLVQAPAMLTSPSGRANEGKDRWRRNARSLGVFGRLKPGVTLAQAQAEMDGIAQRLAKQFPDANKNVGVRVMKYNDRFNGGEIKVVFLLLMGAVTFVLLIACANVANLMLARSAFRAREMAVRISLGATRWQLVRQLLVESVMLGLLSGVLGLLLSMIGVRLFDRAVTDVGKPYWIVFTIDGTVLAFLIAICVATGLLFGLAPALHVSRTNTNELLKEGGRSGGAGVRAMRFTSAMVVFEVALTIVLLAGAGLMIRSFLKLYSMELGIRTDRLLQSNLVLAEQKYPTPEERRLYADRLLARLAAAPGLASASLTTNPPVFGGWRPRLEIEGQHVADRRRAPQVTVVQASDNYFETLQLPLRRGRPFSTRDGTPGQETAIVNERFVALHFQGTDPIGRRIRVFDDNAERENPWLTIVGIVPTVRQANIEEMDPDPVVFTPIRQEAPRGMFIVARTMADPGTMFDTLRQAVREVDPDQPLFNVRTMDEQLARRRWPWRVFGSLFLIFAVIAMVLSSVGIYAVTSYSVTQRTQEIGVRLALGAQNGAVSWLILRRALVHLAIGLVLGLVAAFYASKLLQSIIIQTKPGDPATLAVVALVLLAVTVAACMIPARRAMRLDPVLALRAE